MTAFLYLKTDRAAGKPDPILLALWLISGILVALLWAYVSVQVKDGHARELRAVERDLSNLTRTSQEHASRTLRSTDQVIRFVQARYLELGDKIDLTAMTRQGVIDTEIFHQVGIIDAQGIYALSNMPVTAPIDLSDREHFRVHVAANTDELFISKPVIGRASGKWSVQLTRRINHPNGAFAGVVVVSIDPGYFTRFYSELKLGDHGMAALYGLDGIARARQVGNKAEFGSNAIRSPMFSRIAKGQLSGTFSQRSVVDGIERMYYYRKVPNYDLSVVAGMALHDVLANHYRAREAMWMQAALATVLIVALAGALTRYLLHMRRSMAARRLAQQRELERTEQLNAIFAMSPDGFVSFDQNRRVTYVNPAFSQMTALDDMALDGLDEREFSAWLAQRCAPSTPFPGMTRLRARASSGQPNTHEVIEINRGGTRVLQVGLRCSETHTVSQILYFRDVTVETEVDQMKSEFLSTAAHELRTPMASIFGFTEILLTQETEAKERKEFLDIIYNQSKLMANILDELLDLARIEARRGKDFRYTRVCLQELAFDVVRALKLPPGRTLPNLVMPEEPVYVMADERKLQQVVTNVLSNAFKYSPAGGPVELKVENQTDADQLPVVCIQVTDQGIGMTPAQVSRVCERFYRADTSGKIPGTGLGMSIVKEIIELHRGTINITSRPGQGSRITLCIPANWAAPENTSQLALLGALA